MKISIQNLGPLKQAEFELGDLTIICGQNNTGKTYATYALYGFLSFWREAFSPGVSEGMIETLLEQGSAKINLRDYLSNASKILQEGCEAYREQLPTVFASARKLFFETRFQVLLDEEDIRPIQSFERTMGAAKKQLFSISKEEDASDVTISLLVEKNQITIPKPIIEEVIGDALKDIVFGHILPKPFIASTERTGAAIFRKDLNLARNRLLDEIGTMDKELNPFELLNKMYSDYALPVKRNVEFTRKLEELRSRESFLVERHPDLLAMFADIIGGRYDVTKDDELYFVPNSNRRLKLTMDESSSAVRSLLDVGFYLNHVAQEGDLLMIDEPELNLHPENQRRIARLLVGLVNSGIKVFITTHSDYIVKELNALIMMYGKSEDIVRVREDEGIPASQTLAAERIRVYIAERMKGRTRSLTFTPADIDPDYGIEARTFDSTIEDMNRVQELLYFAEQKAD